MKPRGSRLLTNRYLVRAIIYPWLTLPRPARGAVTVAGLWWLHKWRRARGIHKRDMPTSIPKMFSLSFWGVPHIDAGEYVLRVDGEVRDQLSLPLEELKGLPAVERQVILDCVGTPRNVSTMRGVLFSTLLERAGPAPGVRTAIFYCADGYFTTHPIEDLTSTEAFMAYSVDGSEVPELGYPLRLVAEGKYGYKWAKWVVRIELVSGTPKGHWEQRGLPDRALVGDIR